MGAVAAIKAVLAPVSAEDISLIVHAVVRQAETVDRQVDAAERTPLTVAQFLGVRPVAVPVDFLSADRVLAEAQRVLVERPDAACEHRGDVVALADVTGLLRAALARAEAYRERSRP